MSSFEWPPTGGGSATGTVTSVSVVSAHGFAGTVANPTSTPAITLSTTITGVLQGDGTSISAATIGNLTEATSSVLTISGGTSAVLGSGLTIQVKQSSGSVSGYLSSTDWTTFNGKQATGNYATSGTGDVTWSAPSGAGPVTTSIAATTNSTLTTLSSLASVGTITTGTWNATTLALNHGGTGQTTKAAAFDALQPMTTGGDLIYGGASGTGTRLANGSAGQVLTSAGTTLAPVWAPPATSGTVTSVTFTGDGTVLSSTPSSAVTTTGTVTASLVTQTKNTFLAGPTTGSNAAPTFRALASADFIAPTVQKFTTAGGGTQTGYVFLISGTASATVGATYTNNGHTFTVLNTISAGSTLFASGTGSLSGTTLTKSGGTGDSTITITLGLFAATYTLPTSPRAPLYIRVRAVGGGGGGGASGTSGGGNGTAGNGTYFGANLITANGGALGTWGGSTGGAGGTASLGTGPIGIALSGGTGGGYGITVSGTRSSGGMGGANSLGGAGGGSTASAGAAGAVNTGAGGGGGGTDSTASSDSGTGGGAGGFIDAVITSPASTYPIYVGDAGTGGTAGTNGSAGGAGGLGLIEVTEYYQ